VIISVVVAENLSRSSKLVWSNFVASIRRPSLYRSGKSISYRVHFILVYWRGDSGVGDMIRVKDLEGLLSA